MISFVNNGLFISQNKSISHLNANLFCSYNVISSLLLKFGLIVEHEKTDIFYFSRLHRAFDLPPLDLSPIGGPSLLPKETWKYLGFIFDCKLIFRNYINFYSNKAISTIKCMKLLSNSSRDINSLQKRRLYICCALLITLYVFPLWYYNKAPNYYHLNCQVHKWWTQFFFIFILIFILFSIYFSIFLFLEHKIRASDGHESQDAQRNIEGSRRMTSYNM